MDTVYVAASRPPMHILHVDVYLGHLEPLYTEVARTQTGIPFVGYIAEIYGHVLADIIASLSSSHTTLAFSQTVVSK